MKSQQIVGSMPRFRTAAAALAVLALLLAACADDDAEPNGDPDGAQLVEDLDGEASDLPDTEASGEEPPEGVAATVGGTEIPVTTVDDLFDDVADAPAIAPQLEGEDSEAMISMLRAQILGQLVAQEILVQGAAEDYGLVVTDDDLDATVASITDQLDGEGSLDAELEASGMSRSTFERLELPMLTVLSLLEDEFEIGDGPPGQELSEEEIALQEWAFARFSTADVAVSSEIGTWNAQMGQIEPAIMPEMQAPPVAPEG